VLCDGPDAPSGTWRHWAVYDIAADRADLPEDAGRHSSAELRQAVNDFGEPAYDGPRPPRGHGLLYYRFRLLALSTDHLAVRPEASCHDVDQEARGHLISESVRRRECRGDPRLLWLIRGFLTSGVFANGLVGPTDEGTPQGGPLSPLLSNLMLDELDRELERRGHRFARYADDCNIYVRSLRAGERVMASLVQTAKELSRYLNGWRGYFGLCETPSVLRGLDQWIRRRLRSMVWKQWKRGPTRFAELRRRGVGRELEAKTAGSAHGPWRISNRPALTIALPNAFFARTGIASVASDAV